MAVEDRQFEAEPPPGRARGGCAGSRCSIGSGARPQAASSWSARRPAAARRVLLRSWVEAAGLRDRVGWVSVERGERDAQRFWLSVIEALATAVAGGGAGRTRRRASAARRWSISCWRTSDRSRSRPSWSSTTCTSSSRPRPCAGSSSSSPAVRASCGVVLATREDPQLGLHRLRLAGRSDRAARERPALLRRRRRRRCSAKRRSRSPTRAWPASTSEPRAGWPGCGWPSSRSPATRIPSAS